MSRLQRGKTFKRNRLTAARASVHNKQRLLVAIAERTLLASAPYSLFFAYLTLPYVSSLAFSAFSCECFEQVRLHSSYHAMAL